MSPHPCGCIALHEADRERLPEDAQLVRDGALARQLGWGCPERTGRPPPSSADDLHPLAQEVLARVADLTEARGLTTCPLYCTRAPWVAEVCAWRREAAEGGGLEPITGPPTQLQVEAIRTLNRAIAMRDADDRKRADEKRTKTED
jgi:hypothetical protein